MIEPFDGAFGLPDGDAHLAYGDLAARCLSTGQGRHPLLVRHIALHLEAEPIAASDLVDRHRALRFGHGTGETSRFNFLDVPAPLVRRLAFILDPLNQVEGAVGLDLAAADAARLIG